MLRNLLCGLFVCAMPAAVCAQSVLAEQASGAVVRVLDRLTGELGDLQMPSGAETEFGRIRIRLDECRFPAENPSSDAFAYISVWDGENAAPEFAGWMIASSPALSALDHPRYDVWVLRCINE